MLQKFASPSKRIREGTGGGEGGEGGGPGGGGGGGGGGGPGGGYGHTKAPARPHVSPSGNVVSPAALWSTALLPPPLPLPPSPDSYDPATYRARLFVTCSSLIYCDNFYLLLWLIYRTDGLFFFGRLFAWTIYRDRLFFAFSLSRANLALCDIMTPLPLWAIRHRGLF